MPAVFILLECCMRIENTLGSEVEDTLDVDGRGEKKLAASNSRITSESFSGNWLDANTLYLEVHKPSARSQSERIYTHSWCLVADL